MRRVRRLPLDVLVPYQLDPPPEPSLIEWEFVFKNPNPVEMEIGCGKGLFLINAAQACPWVNFLGVEILRKYQLFTAMRLAKRGLKNARVAKADARDFLRDFVSAGSIQAVHIYFPDPWWKHRHQKRRLFSVDFVAQIKRVLPEAGILHIVTDVNEYFKTIEELIKNSNGLTAVSPFEPRTPSHDSDYLSNFERKFRLAGKPIYRGRWQRSSE